MKMTFRWYGENDPVTLEKIKQIPGMTGVVTALYTIPVGEMWDEASILKTKKAVNDAGLEMEVIESVPVHGRDKARLKQTRQTHRKLQRNDKKSRQGGGQSHML